MNGLPSTGFRQSRKNRFKGTFAAVFYMDGNTRFLCELPCFGNQERSDRSSVIRWIFDNQYPLSVRIREAVSRPC